MSPEKQVGRTIGKNEPCPCASGRKYKRCCGMTETDANVTPTPSPAAPSFSPAGFDPSQMDPAMMAQMSKALQRLPKGQMQRLQAMAQRAMSGKDISREAAELERTLPPDFRGILDSFRASAMPTDVSPETPVMDETQARKLVEQAVTEGKISRDEAQKLLGQEVQDLTPQEQTGKFGKLWKKVTGRG